MSNSYEGGIDLPYEDRNGYAHILLMPETLRSKMYIVF